jgi:hypothetical protein
MCRTCKMGVPLGYRRIAFDNDGIFPTKTVFCKVVAQLGECSVVMGFIGHGQIAPDVGTPLGHNIGQCIQNSGKSIRCIKQNYGSGFQRKKLYLLLALLFLSAQKPRIEKLIGWHSRAD